MPRERPDENEERTGHIADEQPRSLQFPGWFESSEFLYPLISDVRDTGFCLIEMPPLDESSRTSLKQETKSKSAWALPEDHVEAGYLGLDNATKMIQLQMDEPGQLEDLDLIPMLDRHLTELAIAVCHVSQEYLGFKGFGRPPSYLRVPFTPASTEERALRSSRKKATEDDNITAFVHLNFLERRRLCFFYLVEGSDVGGAQVILKDEKGHATTITMKPCNILVFRHDMMTYTYKPGENDIVLQTWVMTDPWMPDLFLGAKQGMVHPPEHMHQEDRVSVLASHVYTAAEVYGAEQFWGGLFGGADGLIAVPTARWDHSLYFTPDGPGTPGVAYARHGAFMNDNLLQSFDNVFFRIDEAEVYDTSPAQRLALEVGYETLTMAGFNKESLKGRKIATMVGDSQSDWINLMVNKAPTPTTYSGAINAITGSRLAFALGLRGPSQHIDTACSSSLVALDRGHKLITPDTGWKGAGRIQSKCSEALITGVNLVLDPHLYIGYSGATMLSKKGRCFTFNDTADGFARGEGTSCIFLKATTYDVGHPHPDTDICSLVGSFTNQDGKSASMTAPNGPSQRAATKASLMMSGFTTEDVSACECHGTGTALGDPIEVSALRGAFCASKSDHPMPLPHSSAKTNMGHNEANAGLLGLTKCIAMIQACTNPPNNHFKSLNANLDVNGYPALFGCAASQMGTNTALMGVSSFGSGGTNARADVWGRCTRGAAKTVGYFNVDEIYRTKGLYMERIEERGHPGPDKTDKLSLVGTWDAWKEPKRMKDMGDGTYEAQITIGDTLSEQFHIILNDDERKVIHPVVAMASSEAEIVGPAVGMDGDKHWSINGSRDQVHVGANFRIQFKWTFNWDRGEKMKISWEASGTDPDLKALEFTHEYAVVGSWTSWKPFTMTRNKDGSYEMTTRIGRTGEEGFQILRDNDWSQVIHPAVADCTKTKVPIRGPDANGSGKNWLIRGQPFTSVIIKLLIRAGSFEVSHQIQGKGWKTWKSKDNGNWQEYYISGSFNDWGLSKMVIDSASSVHRHRFVMGSDKSEEFMVVIDKDWQTTLQPSLEGVVWCGPPSSCWTIQGHEAATYEVVLFAENGVWTVDWKEV